LLVILDVRVIRALKILVSPALTPLVQILAAFGLMISFWMILTGFFERSPRDPDRVRSIYCTLQVRGLSAALKRYRADCGDYPNSQGGLQSLVTDQGIKGWRGPYIKEVPLDPWHRHFLYLRSLDSPQPEILSYGADGKPGGEFLNADTSSKNLQRPITRHPIRDSCTMADGKHLDRSMSLLRGSVIVLKKMWRRKDAQ
jgi:general secretion pathway protein G